jgi:hypothetical protein
MQIDNSIGCFKTVAGVKKGCKPAKHLNASETVRPLLTRPNRYNSTFLPTDSAEEPSKYLCKTTKSFPQIRHLNGLLPSLFAVRKNGDLA